VPSPLRIVNRFLSVVSRRPSADAAANRPREHARASTRRWPATPLEQGNEELSYALENNPKGTSQFSAQDIETVILKSHLLIETQINAALEVRLGSEIDALRLSFAQKLELLACIWPTLKNKSILGARSLYDDWKEINGIRNKIAHQLSPANLRALLVDWVTSTLGYKLRTINRTTVIKRNIVKAIALEVGCFSGEIDGLKAGSNKLRKRDAAKNRCAL
jgi:hypothetical protein